MVWVAGDVPPRGGGLGETWFPHRPGCTGQRRVGGRALWERFRFEGLGRMPSASKLVCVREGIGRFDVQHKLTYRSGEAERGGGSIYGDGSVQSAQVRLRTRPTFQSVWWVVS